MIGFVLRSMVTHLLDASARVQRLKALKRIIQVEGFPLIYIARSITTVIIASLGDMVISMVPL